MSEKPSNRSFKELMKPKEGVVPKTEAKNKLRVDTHSKLLDYRKNIVTGTIQTRNKNSKLNLHDDAGKTIGAAPSETKFRVLAREPENNRIKIVIDGGDGKEVWVDESFVKIDENIQKMEKKVNLKKGHSFLQRFFSGGSKKQEENGGTQQPVEVEIPKVTPINRPGQSILPDGSVQFADGSIKHPDGTTDYPDGRKELRDGTTVFPDGTTALKAIKKPRIPSAGDAIGFMSSGAAPIEVQIHSNNNAKYR